jgi:hypothetical protein
MTMSTLKITVTYKELRTELRQRGLDSVGGKPELVTRLEEDRRKDAGCRWGGKVGELAAHRGKCEWEPVKCKNKGCTDSSLPKDRPEHGATCEHRVVSCRLCKSEMAARLVAAHKERCLSVKIECPNEGCSVQYKRGWMNAHRATCEQELVVCPCPGCDMSRPRKNMDAHVRVTHLDSAVQLLQSAWIQNAMLEGKVAAAKSEQRLAAASPTSWVFNWRVDSWGGGDFESEEHAFGDGITGNCVLLTRFACDTLNSTP